MQQTATEFAQVILFQLYKIFSQVHGVALAGASIIVCRYTSVRSQGISSPRMKHTDISTFKSIFSYSDIQLFYSDTKIGKIEVIIYVYYKIFFTDAAHAKYFLNN